MLTCSLLLCSGIRFLQNSTQNRMIFIAHKHFFHFSHPVVSVAVIVRFGVQKRTFFFYRAYIFLVYAVYALYALYAKIVRFLIFRTKLDEKQRFCVYMQRIFDFQQLYINYLNEIYPLFYKTLTFAIY